MSALSTRDALAKVLAAHEVIESGCTCGGDCGWTHGDWLDHVADALIASGAVIDADTLADDDDLCRNLGDEMSDFWDPDSSWGWIEDARNALRALAAALTERSQ